MVRSLLIIAASLLIAGFNFVLPPKATANEVHTITIEGMQFVPATLRVKQGDKVVWVNKDLFPHTATAKGKGFDSGEIPADGKWSFVAEKKGNFPYLCTYHPTMQGVLTVE